MANRNKTKGDRAEREAAELISSLLNVNARRALGAGRQDDVGDIDGVPGHAIQVASWSDTAAAALAKPDGAERQRINAAQPHAATFVRFRGGRWRVVLTPEQWAALASLVMKEEQPRSSCVACVKPGFRESIAMGIECEMPPD